jgi:hypothetical protein
MRSSFHSLLIAGATAVSVLLCTVAWGDDSGRGPVGWWLFDEGAGLYSANAVDPGGEDLTPATHGE